MGAQAYEKLDNKKQERIPSDPDLCNMQIAETLGPKIIEGLKSIPRRAHPEGGISIAPDTSECGKEYFVILSGYNSES